MGNSGIKQKSINVAIFMVATVASVILGDFGFRIYERHFLSENIFEIDGTYNLKALLYNDTKVSSEKVPGEFRILSFGDSFTHGITRRDYTYTQTVARILNETLKDSIVRSVNLGEAATGLTDYRKAYAFWSQRLDHDAVMVNIYLGNDLKFLERHRSWRLQPVIHDNPFDAETGVKRSYVPTKYPLRFLDYVHAYIRQFGVVDRRNIRIDDTRYLQRAYFQIDKEVFDERVFEVLNSTFSMEQQHSIADGYREVVRLFKVFESVRKSGKRVIITLGPHEAQVEDALRKRILNKYGANPADHGITLPSRIIEAIRRRVAPDLLVIDLTPFFRCRAAAGEDLYFRRNTHYTVEGDALHGAVVAHFMLKNWFAVPSALPPELATCEGVPSATTDFAFEDFVTEIVKSTEESM